MSETASTSTGSASSTPTTTTTNATQGSDQIAQGGAGGQSTPQNTSEALEEIKIGSVSARVSKEIAQAVKNLERGFQTKAQEAANTKKLLSLAENNPKEFYKQTGKDPYEYAESLLAEKYAEMQMTPEQRRLKELEQWKSEKEQSENSSKKEVIEALKEFGPLPEGAENATREQLIRYYQQQKQVYYREAQTLDQDIGNAFKESGLAPDKHLLAKVAFEMSSALKRGKSLQAKDAIAKVKAEYYSGAKQTFGKMDAKSIHEALGDEFLDKIRKYDLEQVTAQAASRLGQNQYGQGNQKPSSQEPQKKFLTETEWAQKYRGR